jgi:hypothetical protein
MSVVADNSSAWMLRELRTKISLDTGMRKTILSAALCAAAIGVALAQVEASSSVFLLDVDPARYAGPAGQRLMLRIGDQPRHIVIGAQDEICVQLERVAGTDVISAHIRALRPEPKEAAAVRVVAPDISPGTYRSTPWGLLLRAVPEKTQSFGVSEPLGTDNAPVCTL